MKKGTASPAVWAALAFVASRVLVLATGWAAISAAGVRPVQAMHARPASRTPGRRRGGAIPESLGQLGRPVVRAHRRRRATGAPSAKRSSRSTRCSCAPSGLWPAATSRPGWSCPGPRSPWPSGCSSCLVRARFDARTAAWTVAFVSFFPTSFFFTAVVHRVAVPPVQRRRLLLRGAATLGAGRHRRPARGAHACHRSAAARAAGAADDRAGPGARG